jgi:hypothetical protein
MAAKEVEGRAPSCERFAARSSVCPDEGSPAYRIAIPPGVPGEFAAPTPELLRRILCGLRDVLGR